ncbi:hypothetical protein KEM48_005498 [Puccinia striiformis f. sp. tritici PST-130]|nr:hypothetical protein KEM48_005498 [Puccinia striiformis f. sp. tritici PST-130]
MNGSRNYAIGCGAGSCGVDSNQGKTLLIFLFASPLNFIKVKSQNIIPDSPTSSELSDISLAKVKSADKAKIKKAKNGNLVTAKDWTPIATNPSSKKKDKTAEKKKMAETFLENSDDGMSKLDSPILPDNGPFSALRDSLPSLNPVQTKALEANPGVAPTLVNSRATSLALRSGMSTPVPRPVDRLTVPPSDQTPSEERRTSSHSGTTPQTASTRAPVVDNQQLEMYINMFHSQWFMYDEAKKTNDLVVMKAALTQAISSQELISRVMSHDELMDVCENWLAEAEMDIMFPQRRTTNVPTPPETKTPVHQTEPSSPQEDVAMAYQGPTPAQATAPPASSTSSVHQTNLNSAYAPVQSQAQNYAQQAVQHAMDASNYVNQAPQHGQFQNFVPNYAPVQNSAPAENLLPAQNSAMNYAPVQNSAPSYSMPSQQNLNQATYEHPRPPQQQQGSAATSHQAGPPFNGRQNHRRVRRDRFHYNRNELAAPQQHRPNPYPVQHQPGGNLGGSRRRRRNPQPQDNTARVLEVGDVFLRAERVLGRMQRTQSRMNTQNRNHPNQHRHQ